MRGYESYDRPRHERRVEEYDDYGYEEDGYGCEEDGDEYEEEDGDEYEDAPRPTKEALEFLELRQRLKEQIRKDMKKKEGGRGNMNDRKKLPYDKSFGSFFGPSQPVIADRVIQESKSLLENQHLAAKLVNHSKKNSGSTPSGSKPVERTQKPSIVNEQKNILQKRKDTRDYTFLFSEDAELPASAKDCHPHHESAPMLDMRSSQSVMKSKQSLVNGSRPRYGSHDNGRHVQGIRKNGRPVQGSRDSGGPVPGSRDIGRPVQGGRDSGRHVIGSCESGRPVLGSRENGRPATYGRDERKSVPSNGHMHSKVGSHRPSSASGKPGSTSMDSRKQLGSNNADCPGRPLRPKGLPSRIPASTSERRVSAPGSKNTMSSLQKLPSSQFQSSHLKQLVQQRKDIHEPYKPSMLSKQSTVLSKHQIHKPQMHRQIPSRPTAQHRTKKRPASGFADDEYDPEDGDISSMIRGMFRYDPSKFSDDDDVSDMEARFEDILREERRTELIGIKEDEEQARLIEEEERRERMAKMRKQKKLKQ